MTTAIVEGRAFVGGEWVETGRWLDVRSPYSGEPVGRVAAAGRLEALRAVDAASAALAVPLPAHERARLLDRVAALIEERREHAAALICAEAGKPLKAARAEASRAVVTYTAAAAEARTLAGEVVPMDASAAGEGKIAFTVRRPIGVVGAVSPFNFPLNLVAHKLAPALAAGCPVVLKPAARTPLSALFLAEVSDEAGLPPGWLNVLAGPAAEIGDVLVEDERVTLITFTGSGPVGWGLQERAPRKRVRLELGNSTPVIVAADADVEQAAARIAANAFSFAGQSCVSVQRVYVAAEIGERFLDLFLGHVRSLKVGDPADPETDVGPVIDDESRERLLRWIDEARADGAEVLAGGRLEEGLLPPTVLRDVPPGAALACEEAFGPVCTVAAFDDLDEAIRLANSTRYGLQAGIFTASIATAVRATRGLEFAAVTVNEAPTFRADQMPYGGIKASGNTREGPRYAVREMTEEILVVIETGG